MGEHRRQEDLPDNRFNENVRGFMLPFLHIINTQLWIRIQRNRPLGPVHAKMTLKLLKSFSSHFCSFFPQMSIGKQC